MDLSDYTKRSQKAAYSAPGARQKKCMQCGKVLENDGSHLYFQHFCSQLCKEKYMEL